VHKVIFPLAYTFILILSGATSERTQDSATPERTQVSATSATKGRKRSRTARSSADEDLLRRELDLARREITLVQREKDVLQEELQLAQSKDTWRYERRMQPPRARRSSSSGTFVSAVDSTGGRAA
jgi:hypothetical protein